MAVNVKNLIAAINPDVYCATEVRREVRDLAKRKGYLEAAKKAKLKDSDYIDIFHTQFIRGPFSLSGFKAPMEMHELVYEEFAKSLESAYFWILDFVNAEYGGADKLVDNYVSSPGSGHFAEMGQRLVRMQEEGMKILKTANDVLRSILNIIYDLKEFKLRLAQYDDFHSKDESVRNAAMLALKQIWMDNVDIKRQNSALKALAQQFDYVTLIDAFMASNSLKDIEKLDLNERVKRILQQRLLDFLKWLEASEKELRKRFEIEKTYLKSQFNSVKLYARWAKPYLKAARQLEQHGTERAELVNLFNTSLFELVLLAKNEYRAKRDVDNGELPKFFNKIKTRKYFSLTVIELYFRTIPERSDQRGGYNYRGRVELKFTSFALNEDEINILKEKVAEDDLGDVYSLIEGTTEGSLGQLKDDINEFLGSADAESEKKSNDEDTNPFSALFSFFKEDEKKEKELPKVIRKDSDYEKVLRNQAILNARRLCRKLYDDYKKSYNMPSFPPGIGYKS